MKTVSIIGAGRVGGGIALALPANKYKVENIYYRSGPTPSDLVRQIEAEPLLRHFGDPGTISSNIIFITTQDSEIASAAKDLVGKLRSDAVIFHTSGSNSSSILSPLSEAGCHIGSIHPLVSISRPEFAAERFRGAFFCLEGDDVAVSTAVEIVEDLGGRPFTIDTKYKTLYHAAAVTACGHLVALFDAAVEIMTKCGLSPEASKEILLPLVGSTVQNLNEQSTSQALTGTFARADIETFTRHLSTLNENVSDDLLEIYLLLGERSLELAARQGVSSDRIEKLRTKVSIAKSKLKW